MPHLLHDMAIQEINNTLLEKLEITFRKHLRRITNTCYPTLISNHKLYKLAHLNPLIYNITKQRWNFINKSLVVSNSLIDKIIFQYFNSKQKSGRRSVTKNSLPAKITNDLALINKDLKTEQDYFNLKNIAVNQQNWNKVYYNTIPWNCRCR